jgi:hypothetical protein
MFFVHGLGVAVRVNVTFHGYANEQTCNGKARNNKNGFCAHSICFVVPFGVSIAIRSGVAALSIANLGGTKKVRRD